MNHAGKGTPPVSIHLRPCWTDVLSILLTIVRAETVHQRRTCRLGSIQFHRSSSQIALADPPKPSPIHGQTDRTILYVYVLSCLHRAQTSPGRSIMKLPAAAYSAEVATSATKAGRYWVAVKGKNMDDRPRLEGVP